MVVPVDPGVRISRRSQGRDERLGSGGIEDRLFHDGYDVGGVKPPELASIQLR